MAAHRKPRVERYVRYNGEKYAIIVARPRFEKRFWRLVERIPDGCWQWTGTVTAAGYGFYNNAYAHRLAKWVVCGPVPDHLTLDHLCRNKLCVNPDHLEPVTQRENTLRAEGVTAINARKTHCPQGHAYDDQNTYVIQGGSRAGKRSCKACALAYRQATAPRKAEYDRMRRSALKGAA